MSVFKLMSAGDDIKIWDNRGFGLLKSFDPHDSPISHVCWSHCGKFISSCSERDDKIGITHIQHTASTCVEIDIEKGTSCLDFNSNSRYLLYGGTNGIVNVWDLKTNKLKNSFKEHKGGITSVTFNWNDAYIASGSKLGDIILHNMITGQSGAPLRAPKVQVIRQIQYHYFRKSLFGSVSDDGALNLWDANTRQLKLAFTDVHKAPATGLAFSPCNEMLLTSIGLDKKMALYDVESKRNLRVIMCESPLTAIDMMPDGATVVVGTSRGKILVYDMRQGTCPAHMFNAHTGPISTVSFHPKSYLGTSDSGNKSTSSKKSDKQTKPSTNINMSSATNIKEKLKQTPNSTSATSEDVFSPVRDMTGIQGNSATLLNNDSLLEATNNNNKGDNSSGGYGIFSPLQGTGGPSKFSLGTSSIFNNTVSTSPQGASFVSISPVNGPTSGFSSTVNGLQASGSSPYTQHGISASPSLTTMNDRPAQHDGTYISNGIDGAANGSSVGKHVTFTDQLTEDSTSQSNESSDVNSVQQEAKTVLQDTNTDQHDTKMATPDGKKDLKSPVKSSRHAGEVGIFQTEFTRNLIREALEDFRDEMHQEINNLHVEMLRQFHMQQMEVVSVMKQLSVQRDLLQEVEQLREENKRLKKQF